MAANVRCTWSGCNKVFTRTTSLRRHVEAAHSGLKQVFTCDTCQKTFSRKEYLSRHERAHQGLGKERCSMCCRSFRFDHLAKHQRGCGSRTTAHLAKLRLGNATGNDTGLQGRRGQSTDLVWETVVTPTVKNCTQGTPPSSNIDPLPVVLSVYSRDNLRQRLLVQQAVDAIVEQDTKQFEHFLRDMEEAGFSLQMLDDYMRKVGPPDRPYKPLLITAAEQSATSIVDVLLKKGFDVNARGESSELTALHFAENSATLRTLLEAGADVNAGQSSLLTPILVAVKDRDILRSSALLSAGARLDLHPVDHAASPIRHVIHSRQDRMFKLMLQTTTCQEILQRELLSEVVKFGTASMTADLLASSAQFYGALVLDPDTRQGLLRTKEERHGKSYSGRMYQDAARKLELLDLWQSLPLMSHDDPAPTSPMEIEPSVQMELRLHPQNTVGTEDVQTAALGEHWIPDCMPSDIPVLDHFEFDFGVCDHTELHETQRSELNPVLEDPELEGTGWTTCNGREHQETQNAVLQSSPSSAFFKPLWSDSETQRCWSPSPLRAEGLRQSLYETSHSPTKGRWKCSECPRSFPRAYLLDDHATESRHRAYRCTGCVKSYVRQSTLARHVAAAHGPIKYRSRDYPCQRCRGLKSFRRRDHLQQHLREVHLAFDSGLE